MKSIAKVTIYSQQMTWHEQPTVVWSVRSDKTDWESKINIKYIYGEWDFDKTTLWPWLLLNAISYNQIINTRSGDTHIYYHFTALAGSYLCEDLQNKGLGDVPGQIPHIPTNKERDGRNWVFVEQEVACKQRLVNQLATPDSNSL